MFTIYTILSFQCDNSIIQVINSITAPFKENISIFSCCQSAEAETFCSFQTVNLFVIYIQDDLDGHIDLLKQIRRQELSQYTPVIFISPKEEYAVKLLTHIKFCDYILSPLTEDGVKRITGLFHYSYYLLNNMYSSELKYMHVNMSKACLKLPYYKILFIETMKHKCILHTADEEIVVPLSLQKILEMVEGSPLIQSHRSFIINTENIRQIDKTHEPWTVEFSNCTKLAFVSRTFKKEVAKKFSSDF